ncbi:MAG TPA: hypothetical protein DDW41_04775 [Candidatus Andersenbacteria bacterium]|nr:hypothetical protein [Candidatus Andersenbacteria bacterium]
MQIIFGYFSPPRRFLYCPESGFSKGPLAIVLRIDGCYTLKEVGRLRIEDRGSKGEDGNAKFVKPFTRSGDMITDMIEKFKEFILSLKVWDKEHDEITVDPLDIRRLL